MPKFKEDIIYKKPFYHKVIKEEPTEYPINKKHIARKKINEEVFDLYDAVADNSKLIGILFELVIKLYKGMPPHAKSFLQPKDKEFIEMVIELYSKYTNKFKQDCKTNECSEIVDKLFKRQHKVAKIIITGEE